MGLITNYKPREMAGAIRDIPTGGGTAKQLKEKHMITNH